MIIHPQLNFMQNYWASSIRQGLQNPNNVWLWVGLDRSEIFEDCTTFYLPRQRSRCVFLCVSTLTAKPFDLWPWFLVRVLAGIVGQGNQLKFYCVAIKHLGEKAESKFHLHPPNFQKSRSRWPHLHIITTREEREYSGIFIDINVQMGGGVLGWIYHLEYGWIYISKRNVGFVLNRKKK